MSCICQCHQRCNHPNNHMHYPMNLKFGSLKEHFLFWQVYSFFKSGRFSPSTHPAHPHLLVICVVFETFLYFPCFKWLSNRTKLSAVSDFLIFLLMCKPKFGEPAFSCEFGCAIFVHLTVWSSHMQSCRTHPTIGTTHWFSYLYTKHKSLSFGQTTLCQSFQVVHMSCICQFHHRCNHPQNHWHYLWFQSLQDWTISCNF